MFGEFQPFPISKDLVHHPIDSQPFQELVGFGVPGCNILSILLYTHRTHKYIYIYVPGDAKGACLSPIVTVGGHDSPLKGSLFHQPKKSHQQNCQVYKHTHGIHVWLYLPTFTIKINQMWVKHIIHGSYGIWIPIF